MPDLLESVDHVVPIEVTEGTDSFEGKARVVIRQGCVSLRLVGKVANVLATILLEYDPN